MKNNVLQSTFGADQDLSCQASLSDKKACCNFPVEEREFLIQDKSIFAMSNSILN